MKIDNFEGLFVPTNAYDLVLGNIEECPACTGRGELPIPKTYIKCPCCVGVDKIRHCKKCQGKGFL